MKKSSIFSLLFGLLVAFGCGERDRDGSPSSPCFELSNNARGCIEEVDNIVNATIVSKDDSLLRAEYQAGFIQGRLQKKSVVAARDNSWDAMYLVDPSHSFPKQLPPSKEELAVARDALLDNYNYTVWYAQNESGSTLGMRMARLLFRLLGIYHGATLSRPESVDVSGAWLPDEHYFGGAELELGYVTASLTFMDILWLNANQDVMDVISYLVDAPMETAPDKCSAFVKNVDEELFIAHNSWLWFLAQSQALNLVVNDDFLTINVLSPGLIGSMTDFGYNNKGIMFNETTHHATYSEPEVESLWMFMRAALAEQFAGSLDEFYELISLEPSGTYMNGYMVVDAQTKEIGLIEMSHRSFVYFRPDGVGGYNVITKPDGRSKDYDHDLVAPDYILGVNYPASQQIRDDLQAMDTRPARKRQFMKMIGDVADIEDAKALITYTDPENPLSIFGRWDLGYGETPAPKTVPDGSVDAKVATSSMALKALGFEGVLDRDAGNSSFWMKFGTPIVNGEPFVWSDSQWSSQQLRDVPNVLDGDFQYLNLYLR